MKVLVTDDDADSRELVRLTLAMHKIQVVEAAGGTECLKVAQETRPDAILLDVMMPFMDGPTTLAALRANPATAPIPVIFLTASVMPSEVERRYVCLSGICSGPPRDGRCGITCAP